MATKIKRNNDFIDLDQFKANTLSGWDDWESNYDYGEKFDFLKMRNLRDMILENIASGNIYFNSKNNGKYLFDIKDSESVSDLLDNSNEARYALGIVGKYLTDADILKEDPWSASTYHSDLLRSGYFKGLDVNYDLLKALSLELKVLPYKDIINSYIAGIEGVPEDLRLDYLNFYNRALSFMDNGITPDEMLELLRYTGNIWDWTALKEVKPELKVDKEDEVILKDPKKEDIDREDTLKDVEYVNYYTFNKAATTDLQKLIAIVNLLSDTLIDELLSLALKNPAKNNNLIMALLTKKLKTTTSKDGVYDLVDGIKFDSKTSTLIKSNNYAVHENVETPKVS